MNDNRCVCCGRVIPEGRQVCPICEKKEVHRDMLNYWLDEWIFPLSVFGTVIIALLYVAGVF